MSIRTELAKLLKTVTDEDPRSLGQIAQDLGFSRQRLHQLRIGDGSASPEAIERALNDLGFQVQVRADRREGLGNPGGGEDLPAVQTNI